MTQAYLEDLTELPNNPWSVKGCQQALASAASDHTAAGVPAAGAKGRRRRLAGAAAAVAARRAVAGFVAGADGRRDYQRRLRQATGAGAAAGWQQRCEAAVAAATNDAKVGGQVSAALPTLPSSCPSFHDISDWAKEDKGE